MNGFHLQAAANHRLDEIYAYTFDTWSEAQAETYIGGLFECFEAITARRIPWREVPADFGVDGFIYRYKLHFIYWKVLASGDAGIVTILHARMHQIDRYREDWGE